MEKSAMILSDMPYWQCLVVLPTKKDGSKQVGTVFPFPQNKSIMGVDFILPSQSPDKT
jgi:hypothetical protein